MNARQLLLLVLLLSGQRLLAQEDFYLPQIANGGQDGGVAIRTTFVVFNPTGEAAGAELALTDNQGEPLSLTIPDLGTGSEFSFFLGPGETRFLETSGQGPLQVGAATVSTTAPLGVSALFTILTGAGAFLTEAGVGHSAAAPMVTLPVDSLAPSETGVAVFNPSFGDNVVTFRLFNASGTAAGETTRTLSAQGHDAFFVGQLFGGIANFRGTLVVEGAQPVAAVALRQNQATLTSTTLPVTSSASQIKEFRLPQVAKGTYGEGSIRTTFLFFNLSSTQPADVDVSLTAGSGQPFPVTIPGVAQNQATFHVVLQPRASVFLQTDGSGPLTAGAASIVSSVPIGVASTFALYDTLGDFRTEAGVGNSLSRSSFTLPVDSTASFDTGVALYNAGPIAADVTLRLLDTAGTLVNTAQLTLEPSGHRAFLVKQEFGGAALRGALSVNATSPVSALTLRLNDVPLSYTTLPTVAGAFAGVIPRPPLLPRQVTGVNATTDAHVEISLDLGFKLTGRILGAGSTVDRVLARSGDGRVFSASVDSLTRRYAVGVPAGTYGLTVCYKGEGTFFQQGPALSFEDPQQVTVSTDTSHDITLPVTPVVAVSGEVTGLGQQLVSALVRFRRSDGAAGADGLISFTRRYVVTLPAGTYSATLVVVVFGDFGRNEMALYNIGSVVVGESDVTQDFALPPLSTLFGETTISGLSVIRAGSFISAIDTAAPVVSELSCLPDVSQSLLSLDLQGNYRGVLSTDHSFDLRAHIMLSPDSFLILPIEGRPITLLGTRQENFSGSGPTIVTLTGIVRGSGGDPVNGAVIRASSGQLTGVADGRSIVTGRSNELGEFNLQVPAGSNYELTATPQAP